MANAKGMKPSAVELTSGYIILLAYDANDNVEYYGKADIGASTSAESWQIRKLAYDGSDNLTSIKYADGNDAYDNIWDDRVSLSYS